MHILIHFLLKHFRLCVSRAISSTMIATFEAHETSLLACVLTLSTLLYASHCCDKNCVISSGVINSDIAVELH